MKISQTIVPVIMALSLLQTGCSSQVEPSARNAGYHYFVLVDASGSAAKNGILDYDNRIKLLFESFYDQLTPQDQVTVIAYAAQADIWLNRVQVADEESTRDMILTVKNRTQNALQTWKERSPEQDLTRLDGNDVDKEVQGTRADLALRTVKEMISADPDRLIRMAWITDGCHDVSDQAELIKESSALVSAKKTDQIVAFVLSQPDELVPNPNAEVPGESPKITSSVFWQQFMLDNNPKAKSLPETSLGKFPFQSGD